ncbi:MAG: CDP-alcohol phosphatidyltransferase family protein, partial [Gemmatimonadales bacterium]
MVNRKQIPNMVTASRLLAVPVLWVFALGGYEVVVGVGVFYAWLSDALDGLLARWLDAESAWGSQFDSVSDTLMFGSALAWVVILRPEFVVEFALPIAIWMGLGIFNYLVAWRRFRKVPDAHLYSAKLANFVGFLFVAWLLAVGSYPAWLAWLVLGICIGAAVETCVSVVALRPDRERLFTVLQRLPL